MKAYILIAYCLFCLGTFAQNRKTGNPMQGIWRSDKSFVDNKKAVIKLIRVKHDQFDHGTFLQFQDSTNASLYYSPMCGNDCIWNYEAKYWLKDNKLKIHFESYNQHGFCKKISKKYSKNQMLFFFTVNATNKDTIILTKVGK